MKTAWLHSTPLQAAQVLSFFSLLPNVLTSVGRTFLESIFDHAARCLVLFTNQNIKAWVP